MMKVTDNDLGKELYHRVCEVTTASVAKNLNKYKRVMERWDFVG